MCTFQWIDFVSPTGAAAAAATGEEYKEEVNEDTTGASIVLI